MQKSQWDYTRYPLPESRYIDYAKALYTPLIYGENAVLLCFPVSGIDHDFRYMVEREKDRERILSLHRQRFVFACLTLAQPDHDCESVWENQMFHALGGDRENLSDKSESLSRQVIMLIEEGKEPVFFINISQSFTTQMFQSFLTLAHRIHTLAPSRVHFLLMMESRWDEEEFVEEVKYHHSLFENITIAKAAPRQETEHLIRHFCHQWQYPLSTKAIRYIAAESGGQFLLAKGVLRTALKERKKTVVEIATLIDTHPDISFRMDTFLSSLTPKQRTILSAIAVNKPPSDEREVVHMARMDILRPTVTGYEIRLPMIERYLQKFTGEKDRLRGWLANIHQLTLREKQVLQVLIDKKGDPVTRDEIARVLWGDSWEQKYSDWGIDQMISRVRRKLHLSGIQGTHTILALKKKGFIFT
jgi:hypothetical protein